jgi:hypothetical protein
VLLRKELVDARRVPLAAEATLLHAADMPSCSGPAARRASCRAPRAGERIGDCRESRGIRARFARPLTWSSRDFFVDMPFLLAPRFLKVRLGTGRLASYPYSALATATFRSRPTRPAHAAP